MPKKRITTEDIAKMLNISRGTVSRALNGSPYVSEETRRRVIQKAEELGFKFNKAARSLVKNKRYTIGVVVFSEPYYFWKEIRQGVARAEEELSDYGAVIEYIPVDIRYPEEQIRVIEKLMEKGVDGIALSPNDPEMFPDFIDSVMDKNIPVLTFNVDVPNSRRICYVGPNYIKAGRLAGELIGKFMPNGGKVVILTFASTVLSIQQRIIGFREVMDRLPQIEVVGPYKLRRTGEDAYDFTVNLLKEIPDINGIYVSYDVTEHVGRAVRDAGKAGKIIVVGYDLSDEIADLINQDIIQAVIAQEPFNQGYYSVKILYNYLSEGIKPAFSNVETKLEVIMRENLYCYIHQNKFYNMVYNI